jgi:Ca2+-binding RTX toxin-like protein
MTIPGSRDVEVGPDPDDGVMTNHLLRRTAAALALGAFTTILALSSTVGIAAADGGSTVAYVSGRNVYVAGGMNTGAHSITVTEARRLAGKSFYWEMRVSDPKGVVAQEGCAQLSSTLVSCGPASNIDRVSVQGAFDNDLIDTRGTSKGVWAYGHSGNDTIRTGSGYDIINAGLGADWVDAGAGTDSIDGGDMAYNVSYDYCYNATTNQYCEYVSTL